MKGMVGWLVSLNFAQKKLFLLFEFPAERFGLYNGSYKKEDFFSATPAQSYSIFCPVLIEKLSNFLMLDCILNFFQLIDSEGFYFAWAFSLSNHIF